jgi:hypothetical protein
MTGVLPTITWCCWIVLGAVLVYWSERFSMRYNAWTTSLRERYPRINPPPTPQIREMNTKIMKWLFRVVGAFLVMFSFVALINN